MRVLELAAPYYVVTAGTSALQGVIMARSKSAVDSEVWLGREGGWFVVQTNYDQCKTVAPGINTSTAPCHALPDAANDPRRTAALESLSSLGQPLASSTAGAFAVVSAYPVHNPDTAFTAVMSAADGTLGAYGTPPPRPPRTQIHTTQRRGCEDCSFLPTLFCVPAAREIILLTRATRVIHLV
jgi:hypothetical protein